MGDPGDVREQRLKEAVVPIDIRYRDFDGQWGSTCVFETQRDHLFPLAAYQRPNPGPGSDDFAPVPADVGQGDDWSRIGIGDEGCT